MADCKSAHAFRTDYKSLRTSNSTAVLAIFFQRKQAVFSERLFACWVHEDYKSLRTSLTLRSCRLSVAIPCRQVTILSLSESGTLAYQKWHFRGAKVPLFVSQMRSYVC